MTARYSTRWFKKDKSRAAMRLACVLALGSLASHSELRPRLAARIVTSDATASWFWDIAAYALYLQLGPTGTHWSACYSPISSLAFVVMETMHKFPRDYDLQRRLEDPCSLVWIFQSSGNPTVDHELRTFSLDCLLRLAAQRTVEWKETLYILSGCNRDNMPVLEQTLRHALQHTPDSNCSLKSLQELIKSRKLPMTNPLDRFVMLMSNASRKNRFVSYAFANSGAGKLVDLLEEGQFDTYQMDESLASWRARTCRDVRQKLHDSMA
ncbi:hypothetical protein NM688_g5869 [Phlebia brevispora]|uniref:Uncharacterized protein n=1 Tax=Phlebia brevispora TaxID=194682 RepID=A0ACC1SNB4_9APHY|nr:hypothetical protein NM688_g5869 [Phlebia brevispora]